MFLGIFFFFSCTDQFCDFGLLFGLVERKHPKYTFGCLFDYIYLKKIHPCGQKLTVLF